MSGFHLTSDPEIALTSRFLNMNAIDHEAIFVNIASLEDGHGFDKFAQKAALSEMETEMDYLRRAKRYLEE